MGHSPNEQSQANPAGFPQAGEHTFSPYALAFDEFAEPRTFPALWDLSGLLVPDGCSNGAGPREPGESSSMDVAGR